MRIPIPGGAGYIYVEVPEATETTEGLISNNDKFFSYVNVKAFGAVGDGITDDRPAIQAAIDSLRDQGGVVYFPPTKNFYGIGSQLLLSNLTGHRYDNITLQGGGYASQIKPLKPLLGGGGTGPIYFEGSSAYDLKNCGIRNLRVSGYDETTDSVGPVISWFNSDGGFAIDSFIDTNRDEGLYWNNPNSDQNATMINVRVTRCGGWGSSDSSDYRAAFNPNANNVLMTACKAYQVGSFVEHTGAGGNFFGNLFEYAALNGVGIPIYEVGVLIESPGGVSGQNGRILFIGNVIRYAGTGVEVGSGSTQSISISCNVIENCNNGLDLTSASKPIVADNNYICDTISGSQGTAIKTQGVGGSILTNNKIISGSVQWAYGIYAPDTVAVVRAEGNKIEGDCVTSVVFNANASNTTVEWVNNVIIDPSNSIPNARVVYRWNGHDYLKSDFAEIIVLSLSRPSRLRGAAAPTAGTWKIEDLVENTVPVATGALLWICTAAGSPGTWTSLTLN